MENLVLIIPLALLGIVFLFVIVSGLIGLGRGLKKSVFSSMVIVLSAILSLIISLIFFRPDMDDATRFADKVRQLMENFDMQQLGDVAGLTDIIAFCAFMIFVPFAFVGVFYLLRIILGIVAKIVIKKVRIMDNLPKVAHRLGGLGVAMVNGLILAVITFMPLMGTLNVANEVMTVIQSVEAPSSEGEMESQPAVDDGIEQMPKNEEGTNIITECISASVNNGGGRVVLSCGGRALYNLLASGSYYDETARLENEAQTISQLVVDIMGSDGEIYHMIMDIVDAVEKGTDTSPVVRGVAAELMADFSNSWLAGEDFLGISRISAGEILDPLITASLEVFSTTDRQVVHDDLEHVSAFLHELSNKHMTDNVEDVDTLVDNLSQEGAIFEILSTVDRADRMVPIVDAFNALAITIFSDRLGFLETHSANYDALMRDIRVELNAYIVGEKTEGEAIGAIRLAFDHHGVEIGDEGDECLCPAIFDDLSVLPVVTDDDVKEFFMVYSAAYNSDRTLTEQGDQLYVGDVALTFYTVSTYKDSYAYRCGSQGYDFGQAKYLCDPERMQAILVTTQDILETLTSYDDIDDRHVESQRIETVLVSMLDCYYAFDGAQVHPGDIMEEMGHIFDYMSASKVYHHATPVFLTAIMQSDKVSGTLGLSISEMTELSHKVTDGRTEDVGYTEICNTIAQSFNVLESINDEQSSSDDTKDRITELMQDLTPESAGVMTEIVTPTLMESYGVSAEYAEKSADAVDVLFDKMSHFTENHPDADAEGIDREAAAVNKIITMSLKANNDTDTTKSMFNSADGGEGKLEMSAYDVVDLLATSTVATDTIDEMVYGDGTSDPVIDPMDVSNGMSAEDTAALSEAISTYGSENPDKADELYGIAALFGIALN